MLIAHTVLIITSGLSQSMAPDAVDRAIKQLLWMKKTPILVLGSDGDDVMRTCTMFESAEMLFDPNSPTTSDAIFSAIKAGLHATDARAFIWRVDQPFPEPDVWRKLEASAHESALVFSYKGLYLTSSKGTKSLREQPSDSAWPPAEGVTEVKDL